MSRVGPGMHAGRSGDVLVDIKSCNEREPKEAGQGVRHGNA